MEAVMARHISGELDSDELNEALDAMWRVYKLTTGYC
jgi:hypothetical protein